ncbi:MAG: ABC transporter permease [Planctomycetes bacterium]|nr:ABC transporter permease [Planctomycetota bacterium]
MRLALPARRLAPTAWSPLPGGLAALRLLLLGAFFLTWQLLVDTGIGNRFFLGAPTAIWAVLSSWFASGSIWGHIAVTVGEAILGFALGTALGIGLGFVFALSPRVAAIYLPFMVLLNGLPRLTLGPIFIAVFGFGTANTVALVVTVIAFIIFFNVYTGVLETDPQLVANARVLGASQWELIGHVYFPSVLAWIMSSLHTTVGLAFSAAIVGEFIGSGRGLGYLIVLANGRFKVNEVYAGLAVTLVLVLLIDAGLRRVEARFAHWRAA